MSRLSASPPARPSRDEPSPTRPIVIRIVASLLVLAGATAAVLLSAPTLGLDLRGGTQVVLETRDTDTVTADGEATDRALEVLRLRVDALGVAEPTLIRSGERRIVVELPGLQEPREAIDLIGRTAQLTFHPVLDAEAPGSETGPTDDGGLRIEDEAGAVLVLGPQALTGEAVTGARSELDTQSGGGWHVSVSFAGAGRTAWERITGDAACEPIGAPQRRIAIVLDDQVISSPQVNEGTPCGVGITGGTTSITGSFTQTDARELSALIQGGALPVPVEVVEQRTVGPSLGAAAIDASVQAIVIGVVITGIFIIYVYRLMGLLALAALVCYSLIAYASLITMGATITLPGLAAFVLAVGMAIDANVLVYERSREEFVTSGRSLPDAVREGFKRAFPAILDTNITAILAAGLLFYLASGPVRGFGVTLTVGVVVSFFSALVITRGLAELAARSRFVAARPALTGIDRLGRVREALTRREPTFLDRSVRWLVGSGVVVVVVAAGLVVQGVNLGVEFTGGRSIAYSTGQEVDVDTARAAVADAGFPEAVVQRSGDAEIAVRTGPIDDAQQETIRDALGDLAGGAEVVSDELIGPSMGEELRRNALIALAAALAAQLLYLAFRFRWTFSSGAVAALAANAAVVVGFFAWTGRPMNGVFLAAVLTVIGYAVNDSVVVFDRVRELLRARPDEPFARTAASAVLQTVPRTVNTGISTLFILVALYVLGGESLSDFALALILGIVVGTISTITVAVPVATLLHNRYPPREKTEDDSAYRSDKLQRTDGAVV